MTTSNERRVAKLEQAAGSDLPVHLPLEFWTDEQLARLIEPSGRELTDAELEAVIARSETTA